MSVKIEIPGYTSHAGLEFTGERYCPEIKGTIRYEHMHRYIYAERLVEGKSVLDVACGEGYGSSLLSARALSVLGVDIDPAAVAHARQRYTSNRLQFVAGSIAHLPVEDASIDVAVCFETIEHVIDQIGALAELRRVLKPEGILIISTPNAEAQDGAWHASNPYHTYELDKAEFVEMLKQHFAEIRILIQRNVHGSIILPSETPSALHGHMVHAKNEATFTSANAIEASYFIAVAGDAHSVDATASIYDDTHELDREREEFRYAVSAMHNLDKELKLERKNAEKLAISNSILRIQIEHLRQKLKNINLQDTRI